MAKMGRPVEYTPEKALILCEYLSQGLSLRKATTKPNMPCQVTVFTWLVKYPDFAKQYAEAKAASADAMYEELDEIAQTAIEEAKNESHKSPNAVVQAYKLRADNLKWMMARMKPKKYGDKLDVTTDGKPLPAPIYGGQSAKTN